MDTIKEPQISDSSFWANGVKYTIQDTLTVERYEQYELLETQLHWGVDFKTMFDNLKQVYEQLEKSKPASAAVLVNNMLLGTAYVPENRANPVLLMCTLFMTRPGENLSAWSMTDAYAKIEDWKAEGLAVRFFFHAAMRFAARCKIDYEAILKIFSPPVQEPK